jgi:hypothetical protein
VANSAKKLGQSVLQKRVMADADSSGFVRARVIRWVGASAFFEVLNEAERQGAIDAYLVKGGFAVELRHPKAARTSEDIDLIITGKADAVSLLESILPASWDSFEFHIKEKEQRDHVVRVYVQVTFNQVFWCTLALDVIDAGISSVEHVDNVDISKYELPRVGKVAVMSREQQLSEWIHCTTKPAAGGKRKNRAKNVIDIFVYANYLPPCEDAEVLDHCKRTFAREGTHEWPPATDFPAQWLEEIAERLEELEIEIDASALVEDVARYIARLSRHSQTRSAIDQFRDQGRPASCGPHRAVGRSLRIRRRVVARWSSEYLHR